MKTQRIRAGADFRYLEFLKDLEKNIKNNEEISLSYFARKHKIGNCITIALIELKIIKKIRYKKYIWISKSPDSLMVKNLLNDISIRNHGYNRQVSNDKKLNNIVMSNNIIKPKKLINLKKDNKKEQEKKYLVSLFWGFIKIELC